MTYVKMGAKGVPPRSPTYTKVTAHKCNNLFELMRRVFPAHVDTGANGLTWTLTFDGVQNSVVQGLPARVVGRRADACPAAVGQSVSVEVKGETAKVILS